MLMANPNQPPYHLNQSMSSSIQFPDPLSIHSHQGPQSVSGACSVLSDGDTFGGGQSDCWMLNVGDLDSENGGEDKTSVAARGTPSGSCVSSGILIPKNVPSSIASCVTSIKASLLPMDWVALKGMLQSRDMTFEGFTKVTCQ